MKNCLKITLILYFINIIHVYAQFGFGIGGNTKAFLEFNLQYIKEKHSFNLAYLNDLKNDALGPTKKSQLSNYGRTTNGQGKYFSGVKLAYDYNIYKKVSIGCDVVFGSDNNYVNYIDKRFKYGGYHMIVRKNGKSGGGSYLKYAINEHFKISSGYNTFLKYRVQADFNF